MTADSLMESSIRPQIRIIATFCAVTFCRVTKSKLPMVCII